MVDEAEDDESEAAGCAFSALVPDALEVLAGDGDAGWLAEFVEEGLPSGPADPLAIVPPSAALDAPFAVGPAGELPSVAAPPPGLVAFPT